MGLCFLLCFILGVPAFILLGLLFALVMWWRGVELACCVKLHYGDIITVALGG